MKNTFACKMLTLTVASLIIFITGTRGQDTIRASQGKAVIKLKMKDDAGKERIIDTTFVITDSKSRAAFEEAMKEYQLAKEEVAERMKEIEVMVDLPDLDGEMDSLKRVIRVIGHGCEGPEFRWHDNGNRFDYQFDCQSIHSLPGKMIWESKGGKQTLGDLIGDIPMERVVSYSIKDRKGGKRIIIEVEDGPVVEDQKDVIVIRK